MFSEVRDNKTNRREAQSSQANISLSHLHEEDSEHGEEYTIVNRRRPKKQKTVSTNTTQKENKANNGPRRQHPIRKQAVILEKPTGNLSYAEVIREVKKTVKDENMTCNITTRKARSGNVILETIHKEQADSLAEILRSRLGETASIRRPSHTVLLFLIGIEDSVEEKELRDTLEAYDDELKSIKNVVIREGRKLRTAVFRVPARVGRRLIEEKRIKIGWGLCRIKEFDKREQACNKCRKKGHAAKDCSGAEKRKCFSCKEVGHLIANCKQEPKGNIINQEDNEISGTGTTPQSEQSQGTK